MLVEVVHAFDHITYEAGRKQKTRGQGRVMVSAISRDKRASAERESNRNKSLQTRGCENNVSYRSMDSVRQIRTIF